MCSYIPFSIALLICYSQFIAKGGGSANKTFLFQQTKALLNPGSLEAFLEENIKKIGTSAVSTRAMRSLFYLAPQPFKVVHFEFVKKRCFSTTSFRFVSNYTVSAISSRSRCWGFECRANAKNCEVGEYKVL